MLSSLTRAALGDQSRLLVSTNIQMNSTRRVSLRLGSRGQSVIGLFEQAACFGCSLNGKPASLDVAVSSGLAEVKCHDGSDRACFNWTVAQTVMKERGGRFVSRDNLDNRVDFRNDVMRVLRA